ncbi:MAG: flagellar assembly peptidoglycan hydrolase FlgJ [Candidatus Thiodiazotropha sp.]
MNAATPIYNDFSGLAALKREAREDQAGASGKVARQFESLFVQMMVKQMRQASFGGGIFDSDRTRFYQDMYDQQLSLHLAEQGGMGLSGVLRRQLGGGPESEAVALSGLDPYWQRPVARAIPHTTLPAEAVDATADAAATGTEAEVTGIDTPQAFVQQLWDSAQAAAGELGLPPEALLAQAALETGWGNHVMSHINGRSSHNLFGIKAGQGWQGGSVKRETLEYESGLAVRKREPFRTYDSFEQSFRDYVDLVKGSPRYAQALQVEGDPDAYFRALQEAGYATDPAYADKILRVMRGSDMQAALERFKASPKQSI